MIFYQLFQAGYCKHCQRITLQGGKLQKVRYPSLCALIQHPEHGNILYDTGYSERFCQLTNRFPERFYSLLTPVSQTQDLKTQLLAQNIKPETINYIVISHFHSDHLGGLKDFPNAKFICHQEAWLSIKSIGRYKALLKAFMPDLLPKDFKNRLQLLNEQNIKPLESNMTPFKSAYDIFDDNSLLAVPLPGHAKGHIGLYFRDDTSQATLFIGDSCWHQETYQELRMPSVLTYLIHDNKKQYQQTIQNIHQLYRQNKDIKIIPSHCQKIAEKLRGAK